MEGGADRETPSHPSHRDGVMQPSLGRTPYSPLRMATRRTDPRPAMCAALKELDAGATSVWATWQGRRLRLGPAHGDGVLEAWRVARGRVLVATRKGYVCSSLYGPWKETGGSTAQWRDSGLKVLRRDRIRALILEDHPREATGHPEAAGDGRSGVALAVR